MKNLALTVSLLGASACGGCISRGSRVLTPQGPRAIEELQPGDDVYCCDTRAGRLVPTRVVATRMLRRECCRLELGGQRLELTSDHPLYCPDSGEWAPAGDWVLGKRKALSMASGERTVRVELSAARAFAGLHEVFDLSVEGPHHNFFANEVLVHNKQPLRGDSGSVIRCTAPDVTLADGGRAPGNGEVYDGDSCTCSTGRAGTVRCGQSGATCICE